MKLSVILFILLFLPLEGFTAVTFNEIAWMGTTTSVNKEWIELYNNTDTSVDLGGWRITAEDGIPNIGLTGKIAPNGFYLLERTSDQTLPIIEAQQIYTGALENNGENLRLFNQENNLVDEIKASQNWPGGDNFTKQTMEKKGTAWQTSRLSEGTPGRENSSPELMPDPPLPAEPMVFISPRVSLTLPYPKGVVLSEILPSSLGSDEIEEWIEIFNQNGFSVDLSGWQIADFFGKTKEYSFPAGTTIAAREYLVLKRAESSIVLNNREEKISLMSPDRQVSDTVSFKNAPRGQSWAKLPSGWSWTKTPTPSGPNIQTIESSKKLEPEESSPENSVLAAMTQPSDDREVKGKGPSSLDILGLAILMAALSGTTVLVLKTIVDKQD